MRFWRRIRSRGAGAVLLIAGLTAWTLAPAGIIELGKKGQNKTGSQFSISVNSVTVSDPNSSVGTSAFDILDGLRGQLTGLGYIATHVSSDPNDPLNALDIHTSGGGEPITLRVFVEDSPSGIFGASSKVNSGSLVTPPVYAVRGIDQVAGDGNVYLDVVRQSGPVALSPISTNVAGATPQDKASEVNTQIVAALRAAGMTVTPTSPGASGLITVRSPGDKLVSFGIKTDDTLARELSVHRATEIGQGMQRVPALSAWGSLLLVLALAGLALAVLRRRRGAFKA